MSEDSTASRFTRLFSSGGILFVGLVTNLGLGFLTRLVLARVLGRVDYGAVTLGYTLLTVASMLALVGTDTGVGRYLPRYDDAGRRRGILASAFHVVVPLSLLSGALLVAFAEPIATGAFHDPDTAGLIRVFGLGVPLAAFVRLTIGGVRGMQDSLPRVYIRNLGLPLARFLLVLVVVVVGVRTVTAPVAVAWAYVGGYVVAAALAGYYLVRHTPLFGEASATYMHGELLAFSAPLMVTVAMTMAFHNLDTLLLGYFSTTGAVGVYNVVYPLGQLLTAVLNSFTFLVMPVLSELESDGEYDEMGRIYQVVSKWIFLATLPLFLVLATAPGVVLGMTFGSEYASGALALAVLAVGFFAHSVAGPGGNALVAIGRSRTVMVDNVAVVAANLALNVLLVPEYGILGAAAATTIGFCLMNGLYLVQFYRETGTHPFTTSFLRPGLLGVATWTTAWVVVTRFLPALPGLVATVLAFGAAYPLLVLRYGGLEDEDLALVDAVEDRVGVDLDVVRGYARRSGE